MQLSQPLILGAIYMCSEVTLAIARRSKTGGESRDRNSLAVLWAFIAIGIFAGIMAANLFPFAAMPYPIVSLIGVALFLIGVLFRWYSIIHLGRFFTVDV